MRVDSGTLLAILSSLLCLAKIGEAIQCYQCDSQEDKSCPTYWPFDVHINALVDCSSFEAHTPGTFCMKITQQSPGWRGWSKITRRCGSRSDTGVAWGCRWTYEENGVWREVCYCENHDGCNSSRGLHANGILVAVVSALILAVRGRLW